MGLPKQLSGAMADAITGGVDKVTDFFRAPQASTKGYGLSERDKRVGASAEYQKERLRRRSNEVARRQGQLADMLEAQARGEGPSVAQQQMKQGRDEAIRAQMGIAAGARGPNVALAGRNAATAGANISAQTGAAAAELRAGEQLAAREQLGGALAQQRAQELEQRAQEFGQLSDIRGARVGLAQARAGLDKANLEAQAKSKAGIVGMVGTLGAGLLSEEKQKSNVQSGSSAARLALEKAKRDDEAEEERKKRQGLITSLTEGLSDMVGSDERLKLGVHDSDVKVRTLLDALGTEAAESFEATEPKVFRYRPVAAAVMHTDQKPRLGVMAQDLERSGPVGDAVVEETPMGKALDPTRALGAALAAMADTAQRVGRIEEVLNLRGE